MKILIADRLPASVVPHLESIGAMVEPDLKDDSLTAALGEHDPQVLVVRSTKVSAAHLNAGHNLALVVGLELEPIPSISSPHLPGPSPSLTVRA